jgi:hypothetical protein
LVIGKLNTKIETALVKRAAEEPNGVFEHKVAYQTARKAIVEKRKEKKHVENSLRNTGYPNSCPF